MIINQIVNLEQVALDKYGRLLADVYFENKHINNLLLEKRLAVAYDGGTKKVPKNWNNYYLT